MFGAVSDVSEVSERVDDSTVSFNSASGEINSRTIVGARWVKSFIKEDQRTGVLGDGFAAVFFERDRVLPEWPASASLRAWCVTHCCCR